MLRMRVALIAALVAGAVACSGGSSDDSPDPGVSATIGTAGGSLTYPGGPTITIPAGALSANTTITIRQGGTSLAGTPTYIFEPSTVSFDPSSVVTVAFPLPSGWTTGTVYWMQPNSDAYEGLATTVAGGSAKARVTHFSAGHVGPSCTADAACTPTTNECHLGVQACTTGTTSCVELAENAANDSACSIGVCWNGECVAACNAVSLEGASSVAVAYIDPYYDASVPDATGGTIVAGKYFLTNVNSYGSTLGAASYEQVLVIGGTALDGAYLSVNESGTFTHRFSGSYSTSGTTLTEHVTCPRAEDIPWGYTATSTEIRTYNVDRGNTWEWVYTKQ